MTKDQATPRPWNYCQYGNQIQIYSERYNDKGEKFLLADLICRYELVGNADNKANARLIVKAVNCHDELVEALKELNKAISAQRNLYVNNYNPSLDEEATVNVAVYKAQDKATQALTKAGEL